MHMPPRAVAGILSVLLHGLGLTALFRVASGFIDPPPFVEETATAKKLHGAGLQLARIELQPGGLPSGFACPGSSYVGVGVTADPRTERIILVGDDTPASRAGLQHDDIVLNPAVWRGTHQEGVVLWVQVLRDGATMVMPVRVGKICIG